MKSTKEILGFYFIILFLSNYPVTKEIEICRIGGKQHICGKGKYNSGYVDNINVEFFTSCATLEEDDGYSCVCVHITTSGIWRSQLEGYNDLDVQTYNTKYLTYQTSPENPPSDKEIFNKCYIGRDCSDITDKGLCINASKCEYINGKCRAKCSNHLSQETCSKDNSCRLDSVNSRCTNSSILPVFKLILNIMIILFLI